MTTTTFAYRDHNEGARERFRTIVERLGLDDDKVARAARVHARRSGRILAGTTGIAALIAVVVAAVHAFVTRPYPDSGLVTMLLVAAWPSMAMAYGLGRAWSAWRTGRDRAVLRETANPLADLVRLEAGWRRTDVRERAELMEYGSGALPLIALALLTPLTLHWMVSMMLGWNAEFDHWIMLSLVIVGHAHIVLAVLGARFAKKAAGMTVGEVQMARSKAQWGAFGYTVLASALPGALLFLIPPILTAATGLVAAPLMFHLADHWVTSERRELGPS